MSPSERRLLGLLVLALGLGATVLHLALKDEAPAPDVPTAAPAAPDPGALRAWASATPSAYPGVRLEGFQPGGAADTWQARWQGPPGALAALWTGAESQPGGYFVLALAWTSSPSSPGALEVTWGPQAPEGTPRRSPTSPGALARALGLAPAAATTAPAAPRPQEVRGKAEGSRGPDPLSSEGIVENLGSYTRGGQRHWWLKDLAADRVFEVPGADDWTLVRVEGPNLILAKEGRTYRVPRKDPQEAP